LDQNAELSTREVMEHEASHGQIMEGSAVFLRTDLQPDVGGDVLQFPGFGVAAARMLVEDRGVVGLGTDTLGIDPGRAVDFPVHRDVTLPRGVWHVENVTNLALVPAVGCWVVVGVPKISEASGFPARVLALIPQGEN
jgi:kynurenine formamidase